MGKRLKNWLSKASTPGTRKQWRLRWGKFVEWASPFMNCTPDEVDDIIRKDFEAMPSHLFQDKYRDILTKYLASMGDKRSNTTLGRISSVRSFFTNEATSISFQKGRLPVAEMAMNEHRFNREELHQMWLVADLQGKAILSTTVSLGWSVGDIIGLQRGFVEKALSHEDSDGYVCFDYRRKKTKARVRGILNPCAVHDLKNWLKVSESKDKLWTTTSAEGLNYWIKALVEKAGIKANGTVRFHLLRKYTFDVAVSQIGPYEAKLLVGKAIGLQDETYLHGLEDRLLERYKQFAFPLLNLDGIQAQKETKMQDLEKKLESQSQVLDYLQTENLVMKDRLRRIEETRRELSGPMDLLLSDPDVMSILEAKLRQKIKEKKI